MIKSSYQPNQNEKKLAHEHFMYELKMLQKAYNLYDSVPNHSDKFLINIFIECILLHARNILDFFCGNESAQNDIRASHFVSKSQGLIYWKSSKLPYLESNRDNINKSLSHLTYTRVNQKPKWNLHKIKLEIDLAYNEFLYLLSEEERRKWEA